LILIENPIIGVTGHRPEKLFGHHHTPEPGDPTYHIYDHIQKSLRIAIAGLKASKILTGMALGVDQWTAQIAIDQGIPFDAYLPFLGQERLWPLKSRQYFQWLLKKAATVKVISEGGFSNAKMFIRNEAVVDDSNVLLAVMHKKVKKNPKLQQGGTYQCVSYAHRLKKPIIEIHPKLR
jgi:uncharacterized phage-like protein YoqJ